MIDISDLIKFKMIEGMLNNNGEIQIDKLILMQSLTNGGESFGISDVLKSKLMSSMFKDIDMNNLEDLPIDKLLLLEMIQNGDFDIEKLIQIKLVKSLNL